MKIQRWQVILGLILIAVSVAVYYLHYLFFHDVHHILIYLVGDIAFVPIEVLLVTLIIHQVLGIREKRARMEKLNMVIGAFFSEVGNHLLVLFSDADPALGQIKQELKISDQWTDDHFKRIDQSLRSQYAYSVDMQQIDLPKLRDFLREKRPFLLRLLENQNLLEHESFTDLLWATFHLTDELIARKDIKRLPEADRKHVAGDIKRIYSKLVCQWLDYLRHLKDGYPYLFSLAMRTNPFDENATVEIE
jgi:predicted DNA-binding protein YlxM (UPF0122 family)